MVAPRVFLTWTFTLCLTVLIGCQGDGEGESNITSMCTAECQRGGEICNASADVVQGCIQACVCIDSTTSVLDCTQGAQDCGSFQACWTAAQQSYQGTVTSSCEDFCSACASCQGEDPSFTISDCGDYSADAMSQCLTDCESGATAQLRMTLSMPISALACCELDEIF